MVTPAAKREAAAHLKGAHGMSERRACKAIGCDRMMVRYRSRRDDDQVLLDQGAEPRVCRIQALLASRIERQQALEMP
jgi:hypothetical protein